MHSYERAVVRIQPRTLNRHSIDWVWSIEHNNVNVLALAGAHRQIHRPNKGVVARADVLQINQQEIEILQHLARRLAMFGELELIAGSRARGRAARKCRFRAAQDGEELRERPKTRSPYERSLAFAWDDGREGSFPCGSQTRLQDAAIASRETKWLTEL